MRRRPDTVAHGAIDKSEARLRSTTLLMLALVGPPILLFVYYQITFVGLTNPDAMDLAQLGRNISVGRGFSTMVLRPLAMSHGWDLYHQPELIHAPLYPLLLAVAFAALGPRDSIAAVMSGCFYLLTIPAVYILGRRAFNHTVGLVSAVVVASNALMLEYATSGLHITLHVFLTTCLMIALHTVATKSRDAAEGNSPGLPRLALAGAGVLAGLLYLTDNLFIWIVPAAVAVILVASIGRRVAATAWFAIPFCVVALPWVIRNTMLTGNPVFGLRAAELWMNTRNSYPGLTGYRMLPGALVGSPELVNDVARKIGLGFQEVLDAIPQIPASWMLAFFLPSLFFRFSDAAANGLRRTAVWALAGIVCGMLLFTVQMTILVCIIPTLLVFSVAYLLFLMTQAHLARDSRILAIGLLAIGLVYPLFSLLALQQRAQRPPEVTASIALGRLSRAGETVITDQPWAVAWHADRPALLMPKNDKDIEYFRTRMASARWLVLSPQVVGASSYWPGVYQLMRQWNAQCVQARSRREAPPKPLVFNQGPLAGFAFCPPLDDQALQVVAAYAPASSPPSTKPQAGVGTERPPAAHL